jgi:catechol 2,3-dioxygenase-like lactoylglutathione lyase family enzyme
LPAAHRIRRISRVVAQLDRAAAFYADGLGFRAVSHDRGDPDELEALGLGDAPAERIVMRLGAEEIALVRFATPGRRYPPDSQGSDLWFQHLAIVVDDMDMAHAHLMSRDGWRPISIGGPQTLPPTNGGVRAFKFRDPDGHPLELIWFPPGQGRPVWREAVSDRPFLGIDHSALSVASTPDSLEFYNALGFVVAERSFNQGPAQERLDGLPGAKARITSLRPVSQEGPGLELLAYEPPGGSAPAGAVNDIVTDWVTLEALPSSGGAARALRDPDGHLMVLVGW